MPWTEERRQKQREAIKRHKPWEKSTGPRTRKGKKRSSLNALKHGATGQNGQSLKLALQLNKKFLKLIQLYSEQNTLELRIANELMENRLKTRESPQKNFFPTKQTDRNP